MLSNWNIEYLSNKLVHYSDTEIVELLLYGFPIECKVTNGTRQIPDNHAGAKHFPNEIDAYIQKELKKGTLIGPFDENPFGEEACLSPMNTRPKRDSSERRVILDLSFPEGNAVNEGIDKDQYRGQPVQLRLPGIDALLQVIYKREKPV